MLTSAVLLAAQQPITRDGARRDALRELSKGEYQQQRPSLVDQAISWVLDQLGRLLDGIGAHAPGGGWGALLVVLLVIAVAVVIRSRTGPLRRSAALDRSLQLAAGTTAAEHRRLAAEHAAEGRHAEAVRESMRAVARGLDERALVSPRPGRTADEVAAEGGRALPGAVDALSGLARLFDDIWYGRRAATAADSARAAEVDRLCRDARPALVSR